MRSQHLGVGKSRANTRGVDSGTRQVLTGSTHHPYHRVLAGDIAKRIRHRLLGERGADVQNRAARAHEWYECLVEPLGRDDIDVQHIGKCLALSGLQGIVDQFRSIMD